MYKALLWFVNAPLRKKLLILIFVAVFVVIIALIISKKAQVSYFTDTVKRGTVSRTVDVSGNVISSGQAEVYSSSEGIITQLYVANGDTVKTGDRLFSVRSTATDAEKAAALATYKSAVADADTAGQNKLLLQSQLETARKQVIDASNAVTTMQNNRNVSKPNPSTGNPYNQDEIDSITSALTGARENFTAVEKKYLEADASIAATQASLQSSLLAYQQTLDATITAPSSGTITNLMNTSGDKVLPEMTSVAAPTKPYAASPVLIIGNLSSLLIKVPINETAIAGVHSGQHVTYTFEAIPDKTFSGYVVKRDDVGINQQGVISYTVYISVAAVASDIIPGLTADVHIETESKNNVLFVPNTSIRIRNSNTEVHVVQDFPQQESWIPVTSGIRGDTKTEVISGIAEGRGIIIGQQ